MATQPGQNRRSAAPPPPVQEEEQQPLYDYIIACITSINPNFPPQGQEEDDNAYLTRICAFLAPEGEMPEESWKAFDIEAQAWYDQAVQAIQERRDVPAPDGFYVEAAGEPEEPEQEEEAAPAPAPQQAQKGSVNSGLAKWQEEQRAKKAAAAQGNGHAAPAPAPRTVAPLRSAVPTRQAPAPAPAPVPPARRAAPVPAPQPAPAIPQRRAVAPLTRAAPQPAPVPQRRAPTPAPQQQAPQQQTTGRSADIIKDLRYQVVKSIIEGKPMNPADLIAYARQQGYHQADSSVGAEVSKTRAFMSLLSEMDLLKV